LESNGGRVHASIIKPALRPNHGENLTSGCIPPIRAFAEAFLQRRSACFVLPRPCTPGAFNWFPNPSKEDRAPSGLSHHRRAFCHGARRNHTPCPYNNAAARAPVLFLPSCPGRPAVLLRRRSTTPSFRRPETRGRKGKRSRTNH
jgi:hypothetical protein